MFIKKRNRRKHSQYPKLVRDLIPGIILARYKGKSEYKVIESDSEYLSWLLKKMIEEAKEMAKTESDECLKEEIADVLEVLDSILKVKDWRQQEIKKIQNLKRQKNGGFAKEF